jgi:protein-tyrosine phosphatase
MAQAFAVRAAHEHGLDLSVESAGTLEGDRAVAPQATAMAAEAGSDISGHRSAVLTREAVERSDLILGMAREHVRAVVTSDPRAWERSFTLKELVRRGEVDPPSPGQSLEQWLAALGADRRRDDLMGWSDEDDVLDPVGASVERMEATGAQVRRLVSRLLELLEPFT